MKKRKPAYLNIILILALVLSSFMPAATTGSASAATPYRDVPSSHWAFKHVVKINSREVVAGYQDGTFKPDNAVTQLEAVLMAVRNMEADSELARIDANRSLPFTVPDWALLKAKKELLFAVDKGLIVPAEKNFDASSPATRAWMTQLMIRMIGKDGEAKLYENQHSGFNDDTSIPARYRGYINAAVNYEIIAGFADKTFKPNTVVTRAQSVVMLGKCEKYLNLNSTLTGKVVSTSNSSLTLASNSINKTFTISSGVLAFDQNGNVISLSQITPNSEVTITVKNNQVKMIEIGKQGTTQVTAKLTGKVIKTNLETRIIVIEDEKTLLHTKFVPVNTPIADTQGKILDFPAISEHSQLELTLDSAGDVIGITVLTAENSLIDTGIIVEIDKNKQLIIIKSGSDYQAFKYSSLTEVEIEGMRFAAVEDLLPGDEVKISTENNVITKIKLLKAKQELTLSGKVVENLYERKLLIIETSDKKIQTFPVSSQVKLNIDGIKSPVLADIIRGDNVEAKIESGEIVSITIENKGSNASLSGTVVAVDLASRTLVLKNSEEKLITYEVSRVADIKIDGKLASLSDVKKEMKIKIELLGNKIIYIENTSLSEGKIVSVNPDRSLISIKEDNGTINTYKVLSSADIQVQDISRAKLKDLKADDYIEFKLNSDEIITEIKVKKTITYEITSVSSSSLRVARGDGDYTYIYDDDKPEIIIPGISYPRLSDFKKGDTIKVTFSGFKVVKIELTPALAGQVTDIDTYAGTITLSTFEGKTVKATFNNSSKITDSGKTYYSLRYLNLNDRVKVQENPDGSINIYLMSKVRTRFAEITGNNSELLVKRTSNYTYTRYNLSSSCYVHQGSRLLTYRDLAEDNWIDIYLLDDMVYEIEKI